MFMVIGRGDPINYVIYGQNDGGNFYAFGPVDENVYFLCRSSPEYPCKVCR